MLICCLDARSSLAIGSLMDSLLPSQSLDQVSKGIKPGEQLFQALDWGRHSYA